MTQPSANQSRRTGRPPDASRKASLMEVADALAVNALRLDVIASLTTDARVREIAMSVARDAALATAAICWWAEVGDIVPMGQTALPLG